MIKKIYIKAMTCSSCVALNESSLLGLKGVNKVQINLATGETIIDFDEAKINIQEILKTVKDNGFPVSLHQEKNKKNEAKKYLKKFIFSAILGFPVMAMMFVDTSTGILFYGIDLDMYLFTLLTFIVVYILGIHFHISFIKKISKLQFNMDSLVSLGTQSAFIYSIVAMTSGDHVYFEAAVAIITLINLGKYLEERSKKSAGDAIEKLLALGVKQAHVIKNGTVSQKDIEDVEVNEIVKVYPGEKIPLDATIISGESYIDESMLTGESIGVNKKIGDKVYGGTINLDNYLEIKVLKTSDGGVLSQIIQMVENAASSKAPVQKIVNKVTQVFVPAVILFSILTFIISYIITGVVSESIMSAIAVLVIACPCALGLATPAAIMVATGTGARKGILIKNAETLEKTKDIDIIIFDKTGTLTQGKPEVTDVIYSQEENNIYLDIATSLASFSHHPLSKSLCLYSETKKLELIKTQEFKGKGLQGIHDGKQYFLGNKKLFSERSFTDSVINSLKHISQQGKTPVLFGSKDEILIIFGLMDTQKQGVKGVIKNLEKQGLETCMLTGDNKLTAEYIAQNIGITNVISEVMPSDKLDIVKQYQSEGKKVAFVGDGINDAPALTQADLSIAMGTGSDIAIDSADIVLVSGDLQKVHTAILLSRNTLKIIKQNLFWAFLYNTIGLPLAAFGFLNPIFASFAMSMSSVSVIANSLRLKK